MHPTQDSAPVNRTTCFLSLPRPRYLLADSLMRSLAVVESDVLLQNRLDLSPANQQKIVERLSFQGPEEPFLNTVHIQGFDAGPDGCEIVRKIVNIEHQCIVMDQVCFAGYGFAQQHQLLPDASLVGFSVMATRAISRVLCEMTAKA